MWISIIKVSKTKWVFQEKVKDLIQKNKLKLKKTTLILIKER